MARPLRYFFLMAKPLSPPLLLARPLKKDRYFFCGFPYHIKLVTTSWTYSRTLISRSPALKKPWKSVRELNMPRPISKPVSFKTIYFDQSKRCIATNRRALFEFCISVMCYCDQIVPLKYLYTMSSSRVRTWKSFGLAREKVMLIIQYINITQMVRIGGKMSVCIFFGILYIFIYTYKYIFQVLMTSWKKII